MTDSIAPPQNIEAEEAVLGSVLIDPDSFGDCNLSPDEFYLVRHRWIWKAFADLLAAGSAVDLFTVREQLSRRNQLDDIGGPAYLTRLVTLTPTAFNAASYAALVKETALRRHLIHTASEIARVAYDMATPVDTIGPNFAAKLDEMAVPAGVNVDAFDAAGEWLAEVEGRLTGPNQLIGLTTGYGTLDKKTDGLKRGELTILAALPSMGKSSLAFQIAFRQCRHGLRVGIFSFEMRRQDVIERMALAALGLNSKKLTVEQLGALRAQADQIALLPFVVNDESGLTVAEIAQGCREMQRAMGGLDVVYIDHLGYVTHQGEKHDNLPTRIGLTTKGLARLGKQMQISVVALCQLNRDKSRGPDTPPGLGDLRDSGHIEADARMVLALHRPAYFDEPDSVDLDNPQDAWVVVLKNHRGPRNVTAHLKFIEANAQFSETPF